MRHNSNQRAKNLRIGLTTIGDSRNVKFWSGTPKNMSEALQNQGFDITHIGPLSAWFLKPYQVIARLRKTLDLPRSPAVFEDRIIQQYAKDSARKVKAELPDLVFAPAGSIFAWNTPKEIPLIYSSDTTFRLAEDYHPNFRKLSPRAKSSMDLAERNTIARADLILYPTRWAAKSAIEDYGADPQKVHVIPWGANIRTPPKREIALQPRKPGPVRLLFVGVSWTEKGAEIAIDALNHLRSSGVESELVICGCTPPAAINIEGLTIIPYLNKNDTAQLNQLTKLYEEADFFILPTRADCYGIVFCEAASYGLPSIAPATGGVPGAIMNGETGILVPPKAGGAAYAEAIARLIKEPNHLERLRQTSRNAFETHLNWQAWGTQAAELIRAL